MRDDDGRWRVEMKTGRQGFIGYGACLQRGVYVNINVYPTQTHPLFVQRLARIHVAPITSIFGTRAPASPFDARKFSTVSSECCLNPYKIVYIH